MPTQWGQMPVPLVGGVDTRSDPKTVAPGNLLRCENGDFRMPGAVSKRNGYEALAATVWDQIGELSDFNADYPIVEARGLATLEDELVLLTDKYLYSRPTMTAKWLRRGHVEPITVDYDQTLHDPTGEAILADRATAFGVTVFAWASSTAATVRYAIRDDATGAWISIGSGFVSSATIVRCVATTDAILIFLATPATNLLQVCVLTRTGIDSGEYNPSGSQSPNLVIKSVASDLHATLAVFDVEKVSDDRVLVVYNSTTATTIKWGYVTSAGDLDGSMTSQATANAVTGVACAVRPSTKQFGLAWAMSGITTVSARIYAQDGTGAFAVTVLDASAGGVIPHMTACFGWDGLDPDTDGNMVVLWQDDNSSVDLVRRAVIDTAGVVVYAGAVWCRHSVLASRAWRDNGRVYVCLVYGGSASSAQSTVFIVRVGTGPNSGAEYHSPGYVIVGTLLAGLSGSYVSSSVDRHLPGVREVGDRKYGIALLGQTHTATDFVVNYAGRAVKGITLDFNGAPGVAAQDRSLYLTGAMLSQYDGGQVVENGFLLYPEGTTSSSANSTGSLTVASTYSYRVYYEWLNMRGERERSTYGEVESITLGAADDTVTLVLRTLAHTNRRSTKSGGGLLVGIVVYRTEANPGIGALYYRVSSPNPNTTGNNAYVLNTQATDTVSFVDGMSDATLITKELDPESLGIVENIPAGPCSLIAVGNNRVFLAGFEDRDLIWHSKLRDFGEALAFNDGLTVRITSGDGPITGLATLHDALVVFRADGIYVVAGDGPDNSATPSGLYATPRTISDDIGCPDARSIVRTPNGIMFKSSKGIYILGEDLGLSFAGGAVSAYDAETIVSAESLVDVHEVRFLLASGTALVFNRLTQQWSVFTGLGGGLDGTVWQGNYTYLPDDDGVVRVETPEVYLDGDASIDVKWETAWLHIGGGLQGFQRVKRVLFMGEFMSAHVVRVKIAYDYEPAEEEYEWSPTAVVKAAVYGGDALYGKFLSADAGKYGGMVGSAGTALPATAVYQFQVILSRQKCQAIKVTIEDATVVGGTTRGEAFRLNEIALEVGQMRGPFKPATDKSAA